MQYELFYLIGSSKEEKEDKIKKSVKETVEKAGGVFLPTQVSFKRRLAYPIKHETQGVYVAQRFNLEDTELVSKIIQALNLNKDVLRFIVVRADELPELRTKEKEEAKKEFEQIKPKEPVRIKPPEKTPKPKVEKVEETKPEKKEEKKKLDDEEIDKKLEEILKI